MFRLRIALIGYALVVFVIASSSITFLPSIVLTGGIAVAETQNALLASPGKKLCEKIKVPEGYRYAGKCPEGYCLDEKNRVAPCYRYLKSPGTTTIQPEPVGGAGGGGGSGGGGGGGAGGGSGGGSGSRGEHRLESQVSGPDVICTCERPE